MGRPFYQIGNPDAAVDHFGGRQLSDAPLGGGADLSPFLPDFLDCSKAVIDVDANFQGLIYHQFDVFHQNFRKNSQQILENDVLATSFSAILVLKRHMFEIF